MPNHLHGIIFITESPTQSNAPEDVRARHAACPERSVRVPVHQDAEPPSQQEAFSKPVPGSLPTIIRSYKSAVTREANRRRQSPGARFWHRNYYEHVIRDEPDLHRIRQYIAHNPHTWPDDRFHPTQR